MLKRYELWIIALGLGLLLLFAPRGLWASGGAADYNLGPATRLAGSETSMGDDVGQFCAFTEDADGGQHIAYYDATFGDLRYAFRRSPLNPWTVEIVDSQGDVGRHASLAVRGPATGSLTGTVSSGSLIVDVNTTPTLSQHLVGGHLIVAGDPTSYSIDAVDVTGHRITLLTAYGGTTVTSAPITLQFYQPVIAYQDVTTTTALKVARPGPGGAWIVEYVDAVRPAPSTPTRTGFYTSTAIDSTGTVHISYYDRATFAGTYGRLKYATFDGTNWTSQTAVNNQQGSYARLVINNADKPVIVYRDDLLRQVRVATQTTGTSWTSQLVDDGANTGVGISAAYFPPADLVATAWQSVATTDTQSDEVRYSEAQGVASTSGTLLGRRTTVATGKGYGVYTTIAFGDTTGTQQIAFYDGVNKVLKAVKYDNSSATSFTTPVVFDQGADVGMYCSGHINAVDHHFYVAYYDATHRELKLVNYDGATTSTEVVDGYKAGEYSDIGFTSTEEIVAYYNAAEGSLHVRRWPRGDDPFSLSASDTVVDKTSSDVGLYASMAIDGTDRIYIAYYDRANTNLRFALFSNSVWNNFLLKGDAANTTPTQHVGEYASLTIDRAKTMLGLAFYDADAQRLVAATAPVPPTVTTNTQVNFTGSTIDNGKRMGRFNSTAIDSSATLFVSTFNDDTFHPVLVSLNGLASTADEIDTQTLHAAGWYTSLAIDPVTDSPAIAYYDIVRSSLIFARREVGLTSASASTTSTLTSNGFSRTELDAQGNTGLYPRLFFDDAAEQAYIAYYDATLGALKIVSRLNENGATWHSPVILATGTRGVRPGLAGDGSGQLFFTFYGQLEGDLFTFATQSQPQIDAAREWTRYR